MDLQDLGKHHSMVNVNLLSYHGLTDHLNQNPITCFNFFPKSFNLGSSIARKSHACLYARNKIERFLFLTE